MSLVDLALSQDFRQRSVSHSLCDNSFDGSNGSLILVSCLKILIVSYNCLVDLSSEGCRNGSGINSLSLLNVISQKSSCINSSSYTLQLNHMPVGGFGSLGHANLQFSIATNLYIVQCYDSSAIGEVCSVIDRNLATEFTLRRNSIQLNACVFCDLVACIPGASREGLRIKSATEGVCSTTKEFNLISALCQSCQSLIEDLASFCAVSNILLANLNILTCIGCNCRAEIGGGIARSTNPLCPICQAGELSRQVGLDVNDRSEILEGGGNRYVVSGHDEGTILGNLNSDIRCLASHHDGLQLVAFCGSCSNNHLVANLCLGNIRLNLTILDLCTVNSKGRKGQFSLEARCPRISCGTISINVRIRISAIRYVEAHTLTLYGKVAINGFVGRSKCYIVNRSALQNHLFGEGIVKELARSCDIRSYSIGRYSNHFACIQSSSFRNICSDYCIAGGCTIATLLSNLECTYCKCICCCARCLDTEVASRSHIITSPTRISLPNGRSRCESSGNRYVVVRHCEDMIFTNDNNLINGFTCHHDGCEHVAFCGSRAQ